MQIATCRLALFVLLVFVTGPIPASGQTHGNPGALVGAQRDALAKLGSMDGVWKGTAWTILPSGEKPVVKDGAWHEVGDRIVSGKEAVRFFEMNLVRVGDTEWPTAGAVSPK